MAKKKERWPITIFLTRMASGTSFKCWPLHVRHFRAFLCCLIASSAGAWAPIGTGWFALRAWVSYDEPSTPISAMVAHVWEVPSCPLPISRRIQPNRGISALSFFPLSTLWCYSEIFCTGMILDTVQRLKIFKDSKTYVDLPLRKSPANPTVRKFAEMAGAAGGASNLTKEEVEDFINTYYDKLDADLSEHTLPDWHGVSLGGLPLYKRISDPALREFAKQIHGKWRDLGRNVGLLGYNFRVVVHLPSWTWK